jgi:hypothetical protein
MHWREEHKVKCSGLKKERAKSLHGLHVRACIVLDVSEYIRALGVAVSVFRKLALIDSRPISILQPRLSYIEDILKSAGKARMVIDFEGVTYWHPISLKTVCI